MQNKHAYVSQREVPFLPGTVLISRTDTRGIITYCNDVFEQISGYTRAELIGKSHNIVRHPDMPPQAFKWLWDTNKAGLPWRGMVKNRCKNGDHYWVRATVAPIIENNQVIGYVSVRQCPTRTQIAEAEAFYQELNKTGAEVIGKVVADEVRKLAERTANSTKDITITISEINTISGQAVTSMQGAVSEVGVGIDLIRKNGEGLKEIMSAALNVADRVGHIASASKEQSIASQEVAKNLASITSLVEHNSQSSESARTAGKALTSSADELRKAGYPLTKCALA